MKRKSIISFYCCLLILNCSAQSSFKTLLTPSDTFNKQRFIYTSTGAGLIYTAFTVGLWQLWYKESEQSSFHLFNDTKEWQQVDKIGHMYSAYLQTALIYNGSKWIGFSNKQSNFIAATTALGFMSTIEIMDGFSKKWGFSMPDMLSNVTGIGLFTAQQALWNEQRISIKMNVIPKKYPTTSILSTDNSSVTNISHRANTLFGDNQIQRFVKDYNAQTYWMSVNVQSFLPEKSTFPKWINVAFGYGAEHMYGGFENMWSEKENLYQLSSIEFPRYRQYFLGIDLQLKNIPVRSRALKTCLQVLDIFKIPLPAIEYNSLGKWKFHAFI